MLLGNKDYFCMGKDTEVIFYPRSSFHVSVQNDCYSLWERLSSVLLMPLCTNEPHRATSPTFHTIGTGDTTKIHLSSGKPSLRNRGYLLDRNGHHKAVQAASPERLLAGWA